MMIRFVASLIITVSIITACSNLSKSESTLRRNYLAITPPGISMDEAVSLIKRRIKPEGAMIVRDNIACQEREPAHRQKGVHSIRANMGWYYWGVMETPVYAEWCFNAERKLIDIIVYKAIDDSSGNANTEYSPIQY